MKKVILFGTFDILHPGHLNLFKQAKKLGDYLIVSVAHDQTVKDVKGEFPLFSQEQRIEEIKKVKEVNLVIAGYYDDKYRVIKENMPNIICLGYDQRAFIEGLEGWCQKNSLVIQIIRLKPFKEGEYKSSIIKKYAGY